MSMMNDDIAEDFIDGLCQVGVAPERLDKVIAQFQYYRQELLDWNTRVNLTAITNPEEVLLKHFLDSLSLLRALPSAHMQNKPDLRLLRYWLRCRFSRPTAQDRPSRVARHLTGSHRQKSCFPATHDRNAAPGRR